MKSLLQLLIFARMPMPNAHYYLQSSIAKHKIKSMGRLLFNSNKHGAYKRIKHGPLVDNNGNPYSHNL